MGLITYSALLALALSSVFSFSYGFFWTRKSPSATKSIIKFVPVACLALISIVEGAPLYLSVGLALGAIGDVFLSFDSEKGFLPGLGAFLCGHIAFVILFVDSGLGVQILLKDQWRIAVAIALALLALGMSWKLSPNLGKLVFPVFTYILVIFAMGTAVLTLSIDELGLAILGAGMFIASDVILSCEIFLLDKQNRIRTITSPLLWFLYWGGQVLILLAFVTTV